MSDPDKKAYIVVSQAPQLGHGKGEVFEAVIPPAKEKRMIERQGLRIATPEEIQQAKTNNKFTELKPPARPQAPGKGESQSQPGSGGKRQGVIDG